MTLPVGPEVDTTPRPLPARTKLSGQHVVLEPLHARHAPELWQAARAGQPDGDASWTYLAYGPFATASQFAAHVAAFAAQHDPMAWAVRPVATGVATGWLTLMDIQPANAAIERAVYDPDSAMLRAYLDLYQDTIEHCEDDDDRLLHSPRRLRASGAGDEHMHPATLPEHSIELFGHSGSPPVCRGREATA